MNERMQTIKDVLDHQPDVMVAIVYGSEASERSTPSSDIDLAIALDRPMSMEEELDYFAKLSRVSSREIDLVDLWKAHVPLLSEILDNGTQLVKKSPELLAEFIKRACFENADFMPLRRRVLAIRRERFLQNKTE